MKKSMENLMSKVNDGDTLCCYLGNDVDSNGNVVLDKECGLLFNRTFEDMAERFTTALVDGQMTLDHVGSEFLGDSLVSLVTFPVCKLGSNKKSDDLIINGCKKLVELVNEKGWTVIRIPSFNLSFDSPKFKYYEKYLSKILDDRFIIHECLFNTKVSDVDNLVLDCFDGDSPKISKVEGNPNQRLALVVSGSRYGVKPEIVIGTCNKVLSKAIANNEKFCIITRGDVDGVCKTVVNYAKNRGFELITVEADENSTARATREYAKMIELAKMYKGCYVLTMDVLGNNDYGPQLMENMRKESNLVGSYHTLSAQKNRKTN